MNEKINNLRAALAACNEEEIAKAFATVGTHPLLPAICLFIKEYFSLKYTVSEQLRTKLIKAIHGELDDI